MSATLLSLPFRPTLNLQGKFEAGARLTVYRANSTTFEPIFADSGLTTPLSNPLRADGYGIFPPIYFNDENSVRVLIEQSNGTELFDVSPYITSAFDAETILNAAEAEAFDAAASAVDAEEAAARAAATEATVEALVGPTYASTAAGLAATTTGQFFAVVSGDVVTIYLNNGGSAVFQRSILSATAVQTALDGKAPLSHTHTIANVTGLQTALDSKAPLASPALTGTPTTNGLEVGTRKIPRKTTTGTAVLADNGGCVALAANFTIPASVFEEGHAISLYNNSAAAITITQGSGLTLRFAGTTNTGNRTLAARGMATIWFNSPTEAIISGAGVT